jgi:hypothetical protein
MARRSVNFQWDDEIRFVLDQHAECVNFQWDDEIRFVLDQHAELDFDSASSLKQQFAGRHVAPLGYIILIPCQPVFAVYQPQRRRNG